MIVNRGIFRVPSESSGGGAEKHGFYLADRLVRLGHEVHFVSKTRHGAEFYPTMRVSVVPPKGAVIPPQIGFFGWTMKHLFGNILSSIVAFQVLVRNEYRFDVIHCHGALSALLLRILIGGRIPIVYTMHDASPWIVYYPGLYRRAIRKAVYLAIDVPCLRAVSRVIAVSPALHEEARRLGCVRAEAIPSGIRSATSSERSPSCQVPYGLFVGQLVRRKDVGLLVRAAVKLRGENIRFVVVGDGPERLRLAKLAQKLRVGDRVTFTGYVSDTKLASHYSNASFFAFPSSAEGFPIVVLEAMSYALPVVAAKASLYDGVLVDGVNSLVFNGGDTDGFQKCVKRIISDSTLRETLASGALSFAKEQFSWEAVARRVLCVYEEVSTRRRHQPVKVPVLRQDFGQAPLKVITSEVALRVPALSVYLTGSMARGFGGYRNDYDVIVVLKTFLVPLYLRRLKAVGRELSHKLGSKVEVNPLPTFRLRRAKGSLFLMKAKDEAKLLLGEDVLTHADTGHVSDICPDWYFSFFSSMLKDLLDGHGTTDVDALGAMVRKMTYGLEWLSKHTQGGLSRLIGSYSHCLSDLASSNEPTWFDIRDCMIRFFQELTARLLSSGSKDLQAQTEILMRTSKGKNVLKNFEYCILLFLTKGEVVQPKRILSRTLIQDRYRTALILLSAAASKEGYDPDLTFKAYSILKGCVKVTASSHPAALWANLRKAILEYWTFAQPVMGL